MVWEIFIAILSGLLVFILIISIEDSSFAAFLMMCVVALASFSGFAGYSLGKEAVSLEKSNLQFCQDMNYTHFDDKDQVCYKIVGDEVKRQSFYDLQLIQEAKKTGVVK